MVRIYLVMDQSLDVDHLSTAQSCPHMLYGFFVIGTIIILKGTVSLDKVGLFTRMSCCLKA